MICPQCAPTPRPTSPTFQPSYESAPTSTLSRGFPDCGVIVLTGSGQNPFCETDPYEKYVFACCDGNSNHCVRTPTGVNDAASCVAGKGQNLRKQTYFEAKDTCAKLCRNPWGGDASIDASTPPGHRVGAVERSRRRRGADA